MHNYKRILVITLIFLKSFLYGQVYLESDTLEGNWDLIVSNDTLLNLESAKIIYDHHNDTIENIYRVYNSSGLLVYSANYTNGKKNGMAKYINYKDKLTIRYYYQNDSMYFIQSFYKNKKLVESFKIRNGTFDGTSTTYYNSGKPFIERYYDQGYCVYMIYYYRNGRVKAYSAVFDEKFKYQHFQRKDNVYVPNI